MCDLWNDNVLSIGTMFLAIRATKFDQNRKKLSTRFKSSDLMDLIQIAERYLLDSNPVV